MQCSLFAVTAVIRVPVLGNSSHQVIVKTKIISKVCTQNKQLYYNVCLLKIQLNIATTPATMPAGFGEVDAVRSSETDNVCVLVGETEYLDIAAKTIQTTHAKITACSSVSNVHCRHAPMSFQVSSTLYISLNLLIQQCIFSYHICTTVCSLCL